MDLMLTSFGLSSFVSNPEESNLFYRMPPAIMSNKVGALVLDASVLLLCDRIIVDKQSFERLQEISHPLFEHVYDMIYVLFNEGFVVFEDYDLILAEHSELSNEMLKRDMRRLNDWLQIFKHSLEAWRVFSKRIRDSTSDFYKNPPNNLSEEDDLNLSSALSITHTVANVGGLAAWEIQEVEKALNTPIRKRDAEQRQFFRDTIQSYLSYINANLIISNALEAGFHDWEDMSPFYREKFLNIGRPHFPHENDIGQMRKLFDLTFPEFSFWDPRGVVKALKDSRIKDLRLLVQEAVSGATEFDHEFARKTLVDVLTTEQKISRIRNIVSYVTIPVSFVPWVGTVLEKGIDEIAGKVVEKKLRRDYKWFYLISELSIKSRLGK